MSDKKYIRHNPKKEKGIKFPYLVLAFLTLGFLAMIISVFVSMASEGPVFGECVAVVEINGEITTQSSPTSMFAEGTYGSYELSKRINALNGRDEVSSVLLVVNSPGGSVVAADEIYRSVDSVEKPVVAYFRETAASGGYYIAAPADYIVSEPNTLTGSLGTVMYLAEFSELAKELGIKDVVIKSGEMKDIGNPMRNMTEEEEALLQEVVEEAFQHMKSNIEEQRGDSLVYPEFNEVLDGRVLSGRMALEAGLVDELGSRDDALMKAAGLGGTEAASPSDVEVCMIKTKPEAAGLFDMSSFISSIFSEEQTPSLNYR
ncbi:signal peptide peptidase SppA [Candidatus Micrarchaeota archaeon]|nr:signal peptide peptidase SppA [Candidatus Micrarchaeota archaeon]